MMVVLESSTPSCCSFSSPNDQPGEHMGRTHEGKGGGCKGAAGGGMGVGCTKSSTDLTP